VGLRFCLYLEQGLGILFPAHADVLIVVGSSTSVLWRGTNREFVRNVNGGEVFGRREGGKVSPTARY